MAATDKNYRSLETLDIVFAASSILMLIAVMMMFVQDYNREFKREQRLFRDVESSISQRLALEDVPSVDEFVTAQEEVKRAAEERDAKKSLINKYQAQINAVMAKKEIISQKFQLIKADLESITSFYNIATEDPDRTAEAAQYKKQIAELEAKLVVAKAEKDEIEAKISASREQITAIQKPLVDALSSFKRVTDKLDTQVTAAVKKEWTVYDLIRSMPILDGFASPYKIKQFTLDTVPIDYNFKQVTRYDRCTTCHQGIDRPTYTRDMLEGLSDVTDREKRLLADAREALALRKETLKGLPGEKNAPSPGDLDLTTLPKDHMTDARISEYCAHPRLDLFVGANSKHPSEKFGCTICHAGQGSATSFNLASHTPNTVQTQKQWKKEHGWASNHYWDYPMLPQRFIESSCLKCHHEVTGVIGRDNRVEAPKLVRGYNLIREVGCFGCHEIQGRLKGKEIGPDLRLEHSPPLDELPAADREKILSDPETAPGNLRKVGPSLYRVSEKTNAEWAARWIKSPREFRPTTKMPHYYMVSNNTPEALKGTGQEKFPDAEISSIAYYLFNSSDTYLAAVKARHAEDRKDPGLVEKDQARYAELRSQPKLDAKQKDELNQVLARMELRKARELRDLADGKKGDAREGRILFSEKGCLACHSHQGTATAQETAGKAGYSPSIISEADFGPDLSQVKAKLGSKPGDAESARIWLVQWLMDPHFHSPRSRMPVTQLTVQQASDIAAWILDQPPTDFGPKWETLTVAEPEQETLTAMIQAYFKPLLSDTNFKKLTENKLDKDIASSLPQEERDLALKNDFQNLDNLKFYVGKKAVGRLGCFGCHDVPAYDNAKPIGTGLNDWGKKAPDRLAFEDIINFVKKNYDTGHGHGDAHGKKHGAADEEGHGHGHQMPYEDFFFQELEHHSRIGYLHQKLLEPRSFDFERLRSWQDRARMPQFKFARIKKLADESPEDYQARAWKEEAEAREAVMTFILGLTAETLPAATLYQPQGDRLAEINGRKVLETYNCAGCHLIRSGVFEVKATKQVTEGLQSLYDIYSTTPAAKSDHVFYNHNAWVAETPSSTAQIKAFGARAKLMENEDNADDPYLAFRLTQSLRFKGTDGKWNDFRAFDFLRVPSSSVTYPPREALKSEASLRNFLENAGPYGGTFADLLVDYLVAKDEGKSPRRFETDPATGDSSNARIAAPPLLLRQGERTQPDWLYQFLLDPQPVRQVTVLRMPKFNMSKEEARAIANYFAVVDRIGNPGIGLKYPYEEIAQQQDFDSPYWQQKNAEYVARLKSLKLFDSRVKELEPVWKQILADNQQQLKAAEANLAEMNKLVEPVEKELEKLKEAKDKGEAQQKKLEEKLKEPKQRQLAWSDEVGRLKGLVEQSAVEEQREAWQEKHAYITDAYRLVANGQLCLTCHQVGGLQASQKLTQGPQLHKAHARLRPEWTRWWIANPQRFLTYPSVMPNNFPSDKTGQFQQWFAGSSIEQVTAARDLLMVLPRAAELPVNRYWALPTPGLPLSEGEPK